MKRLNKKGFTLVELLAVIIILAVVVGITIPAVLSTVDSAKDKAFKAASQTAADWFDRQYQAYLVGDQTISPVHSQFTTLVVNKLDGNGTSIKDAQSNPQAVVATSTSNTALITAAGLTPANIAKMTVTFTDGRSCVVLEPAGDGDYGNKYATSTAGGGCGNKALGLGQSSSNSN